jgi:transketolase
MDTETRPLPGYDQLPALLARLTGDEKHALAAASTVDVIWTLYSEVLNVCPDFREHPDRDRFLLSKGHGPAAYYAVLAQRGFVDPDLLDDWAGAGSPLGHHPDRTLLPGVEISSGSLGHGLPIAVGLALGLRARGSAARTVVLLGDAELEEGSNAEAVAVAGRLGLRRLTAVVIDNDSARLGWPGGIAARFTAEGWTAENVSGRDHTALHAAFTRDQAAPHLVVATVEAKEQQR